MKKILFSAAAIAVLLGGGLALFFASGQRPVDPAGLLPESTAAYAWFPNLDRTALRWKQTSLAAMGRDPAIRPFLQRPLARLCSDPNFQAAAEVLADLRLRNIFLAMTSLEPAGPGILIGFQARGGQAAIDNALLRLHQQAALEAGAPGLEPLEAGGVMLNIQRVGGGILLTGAAHGWCVVGNDLRAAEQFFLRLRGEPPGSPPLADSADYRAAGQLAPMQADLFVFGSLPPMLSVLREMARKQGAIEIPAQFQQLERHRAFAFAAELTGADVVERKLLLGDFPITSGAVANIAMPFAPSNTLLYLATAMDPAGLAGEILGQSLPPQALSALEQAGLQPADIPSSVGREAGLVTWWPAASLLPSVLVVVEMQDVPQAQKIATALIGAYAGEAVTTESDGLATLTFSGPAMGLISPTMGFRDNLVFLALNPPDLTRAIQTEKSGEGFAFSPAMQAANAIHRQPNRQFGILDMPGLVRRSYLTLQPLLGFAAAMSPEIEQWVDLELLPAAEDWTKHLRPVIVAQRTVPGGLLTELQGPVALSPTVLWLACGARDGFANLQGVSP